MSEREKIVAYIEWKLEYGDFAMTGEDELHSLAQEIERGDHLKRREPTIPYEEWRDKPSVGH